MKERSLNIPVSESEVRELKIGDTVYLTGPIYTGRSLLHIRCIDQDICPPLDFTRMNVLLHVGPVMEKVGDTWKAIGLMPTSSIRFEKYGSAIIRKLGIRAIIGKTTMGHKTMETMKEVGCVHLTAVGVMGNILARQVVRVPEVHFLDELGKTEATWVMEVENAGPFIVSIDTYGNNIFSQIDSIVKENFKEFYKKFGISDDFTYTDVNPL